jgi:hypothetical protein
MGIDDLEDTAPEKCAAPVLDLDEIMREAKSPRGYHKKVLALADRIVGELSPAERRTVLVFALADRIVDWFDKQAEQASQRLKAYFSGSTVDSGLPVKETTIGRGETGTTTGGTDRSNPVD